MLSRTIFIGLTLGSLCSVGIAQVTATIPRAATSADGKADFDGALEQVGRNIQARHFKEAKEMLLTKLTEHKDKDYVRAKLDEIRADLKTCSFSMQHPRKQASDVMCGEVTKYDAKTGEISLTWKKDAKGKDGKPASTFPCADFKTSGAEHTLELPFDGPFSVTFGGKAMGQVVPKVRLCIQDDTWYEALLDAGDSSKLFKVSGDTRTMVAETTTSGMNVARPYVLKYTVREAQIEASFNGARMLLGKRDKGPFGQLAYRDVAELERIDVAGKAKSSWIEERIEEVAKKELAEFEKTYDAKTDLPAWLQ